MSRLDSNAYQSFFLFIVEQFSNACLVLLPEVETFLLEAGSSFQPSLNQIGHGGLRLRLNHLLVRCRVIAENLLIILIVFDAML